MNTHSYTTVKYFREYRHSERHDGEWFRTGLRGHDTEHDAYRDIETESRHLKYTETQIVRETTVVTVEPIDEFKIAGLHAILTVDDDGRIYDGSTVSINGTVEPVPVTTEKFGRFAPARVFEALDKLGYRHVRFGATSGNRVRIDVEPVA